MERGDRIRTRIIDGTILIERYLAAALARISGKTVSEADDDVSGLGKTKRRLEYQPPLLISYVSDSSTMAAALCWQDRPR